MTGHLSRDDALAAELDACATAEDRLRRHLFARHHLYNALDGLTIDRVRALHARDHAHLLVAGHTIADDWGYSPGVAAKLWRDWADAQDLGDVGDVPIEAVQYQLRTCGRWAPMFPPTHLYAGADSRRQSVGDPGHCEFCAVLGHVRAHPDRGCADVRCSMVHEDAGPLPPPVPPALVELPTQFYVEDGRWAVETAIRVPIAGPPDWWAILRRTAGPPHLAGGEPYAVAGLSVRSGGPVQVCGGIYDLSYADAVARLAKMLLRELRSSARRGGG